MTVFDTKTQEGSCKMVMRKGQNQAVNLTQTYAHSERTENPHCVICAAAVQSSVQGQNRHISPHCNNKPYGGTTELVTQVLHGVFALLRPSKKSCTFHEAH